MKTTKLNWIKREHPGYAGIAILPSLGLSTLLSKWQWQAGKFSIIGPCQATFDQYELYDGEDIYRFDTLEEAKKYAETLNI